MTVGAMQQQTTVATARHIASKEAMENLKILFMQLKSNIKNRENHEFLILTLALTNSLMTFFAGANAYTTI